ncbi:MAPEG family protein [Aquabacterium sp. A7-Y]|uniref:MAPEG family protein n=1 Tax=Aquabacterium sp. A7-Y TaxID=1349605 RepID=UPI00223D6AE2|nr:MAPEG family protein [Aquabacterium sp. A7-Y]MCW7536741.1 MAPEG family protein [Aquabacterium sp. A7-Y]
MTTSAFSPSLLAVLGYAGWTFSLLIGIAWMRASLVLRGRRRANSFGPWGDDVSPFSARLCRAHANCVENLPVFVAVILAAVGAGRSDITDPLALGFLAARIAQSGVHLWSVSSRAVAWRFAFMVAQMLVLCFWLVRLVLLALP